MIFLLNISPNFGQKKAINTVNQTRRIDGFTSNIKSDIFSLKLIHVVLNFHKNIKTYFLLNPSRKDGEHQLLLLFNNVDYRNVRCYYTLKYNNH